MPHPRILIVGAGPTGLTAALELARRGIVPEVVEQREAPSDLARAVVILPGTMRLLEPSGVNEAIRSEAVAIHGALFHLEDAPMAHIPLDLESDPNARLFGLAQDRTEAHLREASIPTEGDHFLSPFLCVSHYPPAIDNCLHAVASCTS